MNESLTDTSQPKAIPEVINNTNSDIYSGLNSAQIPVLREINGFNKILFKPKSLITIFLSQLINPTVIVLLLILAISNYLKEYNYVYLLSTVLGINTLLSTWLIYSNMQSISNIRNSIDTQVNVTRDNQKQVISTTELLPGDLITLYSGDNCPCDIEVISNHDCYISKSQINGNLDEIGVADKDIIYYASSIVSGSLTAKVIATGKACSDLKNQTLSVVVNPNSNYSKMTKSILFFYFFICIAYVGLIIGILYFKNNLNIESGLFVLALILSTFPESYPLFTTLALSKGVNLANQSGLILKELATIEELGNVDIICSDKTGTLTQQEYSISKVVIEDNRLYSYINKIPTNQETSILDKLIIDYSTKPTYIKSILNTGEFIEHLPYDSKLKLSGYKFKNGIIWMGSPVELMKMLVLDPTRKVDLLDHIENEEVNATKAIGVGWQDLYDYSRVYLGSYFIEDTISQGVDTMIQNLSDQNIQFKLLSGDSLTICIATALKSGMITSQEQCITASELNFTDPKVLSSQLAYYKVIAKATPEQKQSIIKSLVTNNTVAYLGDGISDILPLLASSIGLVVEKSSDLVTEVADGVIVNKSLESITDAINIGRNVYYNINTYIKYILTLNFMIMFGTVAFTALLDYIPLQAIQILIATLVIDICSLVLAFGFESNRILTKPKKFNIFRALFVAITIGVISLLIDIAFYRLFSSISPSQFQSSWFVVATINKLALLFVLKGSSISQGLKSIKFREAAIWIVGIGLVMSIGYKFFAQLLIANVNESLILPLASLSILFVLLSLIAKELIHRLNIS